ncbi:MAG: hypothetical protein V3V00_15675 [Saprospiraceae bacterium]
MELKEWNETLEEMFNNTPKEHIYDDDENTILKFLLRKSPDNPKAIND